MLSHRNLTGATSEALVIAYLSSLGREIYVPMSSHSRADLAYRLDGRLVAVQVKTASWNVCSNSPHRYEQARVAERLTREAYTPEDIDELWVVGTHLWNFPVSVIQGKKSLTLNSTNAEPRKSVRDYDPEDYIVVYGSIRHPFRERWKMNASNPLRLTTVPDYAPSTLRKMKYEHA